MNIFLIVTVTALWLAVGCPGGLLGDDVPMMTRALYYSFFHANLFHLACNSLALWTVFQRGRIDNASTLLISYLIAIAVYPLSVVPAVGISNIIYAAIGIRTPRLSSPWWRQKGVKVFIAVTLLMVFIPSVSAITHIEAMLLGMAVSFIKRTYYGIEYR